MGAHIGRASGGRGAAGRRVMPWKTGGPVAPSAAAPLHCFGTGVGISQTAWVTSGVAIKSLLASDASAGRYRRWSAADYQHVTRHRCPLPLRCRRPHLTAPACGAQSPLRLALSAPTPDKKRPLSLPPFSALLSSTQPDVYWLGLSTEAALFPLAMLLSRLFSVSLFSGTVWTDAVAIRDGVLLTAPFAAIFLSLGIVPLEAIQRLQRLTELATMRVFGRRNVIEVLLFCIAAGFGEEALFRGLLQGGLLQKFGNLPLAMALSAVAFGAAHAATPAYFFLSAMAGAFFSWEYEFLQHNLVGPSVTHALYDWITVLVVKQTILSDKNSFWWKEAAEHSADTDQPDTKE
ncbi:hypothetical protein CDCA_CDCA01G0449 [Cyanidium caldarium]|uniref:CAAX prenyl protease 2/Lysostaphin resistance protein A-like domain-containing protein n=1 Tax=Cyanidium caldarium TaxID=2771 RepID=A0AAV9IQL4_CYACA|nr:hypothetical protein CDCA_CDCA01G0449 [Cyanidium caldarium]